MLYTIKSPTMSQSRSEIFVSIPSPLPMVFFLCTRVDRSLRMRLITSWPWPRPPAAAAEDGSGDPENDLLGSRGGLLFSSSYFLLGRVQLLCLPTAATVFHLREEGKIANNVKINLSKSCPLSQVYWPVLTNRHIDSKMQCCGMTVLKPFGKFVLY